MVRYIISLLAVAACLGSACTTFNNARPLAPGEHAAMVTLGGPVADVPGVGTIPMPNVTVEGRHGVVDHLDVNYGVHLLPLAFGVVGGHVGGTFQLYDEPAAWVPVTSIGQRLFFFTNLLDPRKEQKDAYALSQTDLTLSWKLWESLVYGGVSAYVPIDVEDRTLHLAPFVGVEIHPGLDWLRVQVEGRWLSPTTDQRFAIVNWQAPGDMGALAVNLGVAVEFSELFAVLVNDGKAPPADTAADTVTDSNASATDTSTAREQP